MKSFNDFLKEYYDTEDVPKLSKDEIRDMVHVRPYHNKVQSGSYVKGSADINYAFSNLMDQEKIDIITFLDQKVENIFDTNIFDYPTIKSGNGKGYVSIDKYHEGQFSVSYNIRDREIKTKFGKIEIRVEFHLEYNAEEDLLLQDEKGTYSFGIWVRETSSEYKERADKFKIGEDLYFKKFVIDNKPYEEVDNILNKCKKVLDDFIEYLKETYEINYYQLLPKES